MRRLLAHARWLEQTADPNFAKRVLAISLVLHLVVPFFSLGHHHPDEHFQILEPLGHRLHGTPAADLPWEIHAQIRPYLQVLAMRAMVWPLEALGIADHLVYELMFRLAASLLGFVSLLALLRAFGDMVCSPAWHRWAVGGTALLWPIPYLHARISSETVGASILLVAVAGLAGPRPGHSSSSWLRELGYATLVGVSFMVRFQLGFAIAGLFLHALAIERSARRLVVLSAGLAIGIAMGVLADRWGYHAWVFTPWRYFDANILRGAAAGFGTSPPWWYLAMAALWLGPPWSLLFIGGLGGAWWIERRHVLTWLSVPFFVAHCIVGHKELRFLFPLVAILPLLAARFWEHVAARRERWGRVVPRLLGVYAVLNGPALLIQSFRPAHVAHRYFAYVYRTFPDGYDVHWIGRSPMQLAELEVHYFRPEPYRQTELASSAELDALTASIPALVVVGRASEADLEATLRERCAALVSTIPPWMRAFGLENTVADRNDWTLYRCTPPIR